MKLWTVWVQAQDEATWLEEAWEDEQTAENRSGWEDAVDRVRKLCSDNDYEMRMVVLEFPGSVVYGAFEYPTATATASVASELRQEETQ